MSSPTRAAALLGLIWLASCSLPDSGNDGPGPVVIIGIDGGAWTAIEELWSKGRLPNLQKLANSGVTAELIPVADASPVIWTSMATGVVPERHGITNFVVQTDAGYVPVSSAVRRVPAIWTMVSTLERRVAVLGWWASWPAEDVNGVVVSDRLLGTADATFFPPQRTSEFRSIIDDEIDRGEVSPSETRISRQDRAVAAFARGTIASDYDLVLLYQRNVDAQSHQYWKYFRPATFDTVPQEELQLFADRIPAAYDRVDQLLGDLLALANPRTTFFVVSDHGFYALKRPRSQVSLDLDLVLEGLGYLERVDGSTKWSNTAAVSWDTPLEARHKLVRLARADGDPRGMVNPDEVDSTRDRLTQDLSELEYKTGKPVFYVREPRREEIGRGADITAVIQSDGATTDIYFNGRIIPADVRIGQEISGGHARGTKGIFIASGPIIDSSAKPAAVHSLDITPTLLAAMGLPVAADFDGRPRIELFQNGFLEDYPLQTIASWGAPTDGQAIASDDDEALIEELKALGYLD